MLIFQSKKAISDEPHSPQLARVEKRLLGIPLLYILLRMWGTLQFFYSLAVDHTNKNGCIPPDVQKIYFAFGILQVSSVACMHAYVGWDLYSETSDKGHSERGQTKSILVYSELPLI